jgi:hypothetical protein
VTLPEEDPEYIEEFSVDEILEGDLDSMSQASASVDDGSFSEGVKNRRTAAINKVSKEVNQNTAEKPLKLNNRPPRRGPNTLERDSQNSTQATAVAAVSGLQTRTISMAPF